MNQGQVQIALPSFSPIVKKLLIITLGAWIIGQIILERYLSVPIMEWFGLLPGLAIGKFYLWQFVTYIFLHSYNVFHILFNMLMLWWIGAELERYWGSKYFLTFYLVSGVGAGIIYSLGVWIYVVIAGDPMALSVPVVGASGAIFGLMVAYGMLFGDRVIYFMMLFPMKAKYFVMILGLVEVMNLLSYGVTGNQVANLAHLGGLISGFLFLILTIVYKQKPWSRRVSQRGRKLRLVVDNTNKDKHPRYWN